MDRTVKTKTQSPVPAKTAAETANVRKPKHHGLQVTVARREAAGLLAAPGVPRLLDRVEVVAIVGATYPTLWDWMRAGKFPRSRIVGGKSKWLSTEVDAWLATLPVRPLNGDAPTKEVAS